jgi:hypothetical protein
MIDLTRALYTAEATAEGGREGHVLSADTQDDDGADVDGDDAGMAGGACAS